MLQARRHQKGIPMPLEILAPMVVVGIAAMYFLVRNFANSPERLLNNEDQVSDIFRLDYPTAMPAGKLLIAADHRSAILPLSQPHGHIGLVLVMGSKHVTRLLGGRDIRRIAKADKCALELYLNDFTLPEITMHFSTGSKRDHAMDTIVEHVEYVDNPPRKPETMA